MLIVFDNNGQGLQVRETMQRTKQCGLRENDSRPGFLFENRAAIHNCDLHETEVTVFDFFAHQQSGQNESTAPHTKTPSGSVYPNTLQHHLIAQKN